MLKINESLERQRETMAAAQHTIDANPKLFEELEKAEVDLSYYDGEINVRFTGEAARLRQVWSILRRHGYVPGSHPTEDDKISFSDWWRKTDSVAIWFSFTSSLCKRVQVGTRTVEEPVYEVHCGEPISAPSELGELI